MKTNGQIARIMSQEMDRKDFLKYGGSVLLAVLGISGLISALTRIGSGGESKRNGYGDSPYGQ